MSGGYFDYKQHEITDIADSVEQLILDNESTYEDEYNDSKGRNYGPKVITAFMEGLVALRVAQVYAQRIDYLLTGDDSEEEVLGAAEGRTRRIDEGRSA